MRPRIEARQLFTYNRWASLRLLDAADHLGPDDLIRDLGSSFPSVLATLVHMVGAEWVWLERWSGRSPTGFPDAAALESVASVRNRWDDLWQRQLAFLAALDHEALTQAVAYRTFAGVEDVRPLIDLMRHVVNHATYHRGQLATLLRQLGHPPPSTDYVRFLRESASA